MLQVVGLWVSPGRVKGCGPHGGIRERFNGHNQKTRKRKLLKHTDSFAASYWRLSAPCLRTQRETLYSSVGKKSIRPVQSQHTRRRDARCANRHLLSPCDDKRRQFPAASESPTRQRGVFPGLVGLTRLWISFPNPLKSANQICKQPVFVCVCFFSTSTTAHVT